jgi:hypothetical protein
MARGDVTPARYFELPLLRELAASPGARRVDLHNRVAHDLEPQFRPDDYLRSSGGQDRWQKNVDAALNRLRVLGLVESRQDGAAVHYRLTEMGAGRLRVLEREQARIRPQRPSYNDEDLLDALMQADALHRRLDDGGEIMRPDFYDFWRRGQSRTLPSVTTIRRRFGGWEVAVELARAWL